MKGTILDFSIGDSQGVISGDDGNRYKFVGKEWKSSTPPQAGLRVDYETEGRTALDIYFDRTRSTSKSSSLIEDFYRSSDDKIFAGVCAGLAHKWNVNLPGLRFATFLATLFFGCHYLFTLLVGSFFLSVQQSLLINPTRVMKQCRIARIATR